MTEQPSDLYLGMVSTPVQPSGDTAFVSRLSPFNLVRLAQKGMTLGLILILSVGAYFTISRFFVKSIKVSGMSMVPTLQENNSYLLNLWAFHHRNPEHNDIVVIRDPGDHGLSVKRVIAVAGESVHFKNGNVYVDGRQLYEPYLLGHAHTYTYSQAKEQIITCGPDQYFVLGDNRLKSIDSRSYGPVSRKDVLGLVDVRQK